MQTAEKDNPVTRIVNLLKGFGDKLKIEAKQEEKLYLKYKCQIQHSISKKELEIENSKSLKTSLTERLANNEAGRTEYTDERAKNEKSIRDLFADMESMEAQETKDKETFDKADLDCNETNDALREALSVLEEATKDHVEGASFLVTGRSRVSLQEKSMKLAKAVEISKMYLTSGDATFFEKLMDGQEPEMPKRDYTKINKENKYMKNYTRRSGGIIKTISDLLATNEASCADTRKARAEAVTLHENLMEEKQAELETSQKLLAEAEREKGASGLAAGSDKKQIAQLEKDIKELTAAIEKMDTALTSVTKDSKDRVVAREEEISTIEKAIQILYNDDIRDVHAASHKSRGYMFLQTGQQSERLLHAANHLNKLADSTGDVTLKKVARSIKMGAGGMVESIDEVVAEVDKMTEKLKNRLNEYETLKEEAEESRRNLANEAVVAARGMDQETEVIDERDKAIATAEAEIEDIKASIEGLKKELADAQATRNEENELYKLNEKFDQESRAACVEATGVLEDFYGAFVQVNAHSHDEPEEIAKPFEGAYEKKSNPASQIIMILKMISTDIEDDEKKAKLQEEDSVAAFESFKESNLKDMNRLETAKSTELTIILEASMERKASRTKRGAGFKQVQAKLGSLKSERESGEFYTRNFQVHKKNTELELEGLADARIILVQYAEELATSDAELQKAQDLKIKNAQDIEDIKDLPAVKKAL